MNLQISPQIKSLVYKELQIKAIETFEEITKKSLKDKENITLNEVWTLWHQERLNQKLVQPKTLAGEEVGIEIIFKSIFLKRP